MLHVLPPTVKPVLQPIKANFVNTDSWLDKITRESRHARELRDLLQIKFALCLSGKTRNKYRFCGKK